MRFVNWSSLMFQVTFGNCLRELLGQCPRQREAGLEVGQQLDGLRPAARRLILGRDRRGDDHRELLS